MLIQELYTKLKNFNTSYVVIKLRTTKLNTTLFSISIHLMLLLNRDCFQFIIYRFHYFNTSYVVIKLSHTSIRSNSSSYFNTSYVVIKLQRHILKKPITRISIHLMLLLNLSTLQCRNLNERFQYILCCY
mgnify:CR=1 FL=1